MARALLVIALSFVACVSRVWRGSLVPFLGCQRQIRPYFAGGVVEWPPGAHLALLRCVYDATLFRPHAQVAVLLFKSG